MKKIKVKILSEGKKQKPISKKELQELRETIFANEPKVLQEAVFATAVATGLAAATISLIKWTAGTVVAVGAWNTFKRYIMGNAKPRSLKGVRWKCDIMSSDITMHIKNNFDKKFEYLHAKFGNMYGFAWAKYSKTQKEDIRKAARKWADKELGKVIFSAQGDMARIASKSKDPKCAENMVEALKDSMESLSEVYKTSEYWLWGTMYKARTYLINDEFSRAFDRMLEQVKKFNKTKTQKGKVPPSLARAATGGTATGAGMAQKPKVDKKLKSRLKKRRDWFGLCSRCTGTSNKIKEIKKALNAIMGTTLFISASFDSQTQAIVKKFQKRAGIGVDGIVGPVTLRELEKASKTSSTPAAPTTGTPAPSAMPPGGDAGAGAATPDVVRESSRAKKRKKK